MSEARPTPDGECLLDHFVNIADPISGLLPLMDGALHFGPSALCHNSPELGEPLTSEVTRS